MIWLLQVNNNLRCYDLSIDLSHTIMEALTIYYEEQVFIICALLEFYLICEVVLLQSRPSIGLIILPITPTAKASGKLIVLLK